MDLRLPTELEHECQKLLSDLNQLDYQGPFTVALQDHYNRIIDDHWKSTLPDPLTVLPPEICTQIFTVAALGNGDGDPVDNALLMSTVSSRWFHYLLSVSALWTRIIISHDTEHSMAKVASCLALSGLRNISVTIDSHNWRAYIEMLSPHASRIERIDLKRIDVFSQFAESLGYLPALRSINLPPRPHQNVDMDQNSLLFMDNAPSLTSLGSFNLSRTILHHPHATNLTTIRTRVSFNEFLSILSTSERLLQLSMSHISFDAPIEDKDVNRKYDPRTLISVGSLHLLQYSPTYGNFFRHHFRSVDYLRVKLTGNELGELLLALRALQIKRLSLDFFRTTKLTLSQSDYPVLGSIDSLSITTDQAMNLEPLAERMPVIMPSLEFVGISNPASSIGIRFLGQLRHLRELHASSMDQMKDPIDLDRLERLELSTDTISDLDLLRLRKLRSIRIRTYKAGFSSEEAFPASYLIPPSSCRTLTSVNISFHPSVRLRLDSLPSLQKLHLRWEIMQGWGCDLLEQLIFTPRICRDLQVIGLSSALLEWDLLLLLLLRRNFLQERSVSRIREMGFYTQIPMSLAWSISSLLRCRLIPSLELEEFSLEKVTKLLFNSPSE
ncbi:hypothetical protein FRC17_002754 [Serendipita sp. 399]|nr:hypothetical protein FRC17_002754 [Serendipita sp. 399]